MEREASADELRTSLNFAHWGGSGDLMTDVRKPVSQVFEVRAGKGVRKAHLIRDES